MAGTPAKAAPASSPRTRRMPRSLDKVRGNSPALDRVRAFLTEGVGGDQRSQVRPHALGQLPRRARFLKETVERLPERPQQFPAIERGRPGAVEPGQDFR